jgi:hypothetical protein
MEESLKSLSLINNKKLDYCIESNTFEKMRKQEIENYSKKNISMSDKTELCPKDINNINSYKTRNGKIGDYINYLTQEDIKKIDKLCNELF